MKLGIIGVGHLAVSILHGLMRAGHAPEEILLSPRGHGPQMARDHGFAQADSNAQIVHECDIILVAVRPDDAPGAVIGLPWRAGQIMLSACAGVPLAAYDVGAATPMRIMPITAAKLGASPTLAYPDLPEARPLLEAIGTVIPLRSEAEFEAATVSAAMYGWAQALIRTGADWTATQGMDAGEARQLVARTFTAAGRMIAEEGAPMDDILASLCTPGGITRAGLDHLEATGVPSAWEGACDLVLRRLQG
ncbi:pyrroline-5-carboxylate reductase family protein [Roseovarius sp. Pro17]|uniref:pyrroline-5-carboxylate reductase family protein n=1 Tax=Roseovarius sp. Pro17 TaxID=3108175 RepID=UPI002D779980|nr:pyrroline-5-carboxylate reductase dimerization domain-containing protein [Roseovarius sp. Pro17]